MHDTRFQGTYKMILARQANSAKKYGVPGKPAVGLGVVSGTPRKDSQEQGSALPMLHSIHQCGSAAAPCG
jgi:hypothetical protein